MTHTLLMNIKEYLRQQGIGAAEITNVKLAGIVGISESTFKRELARNEKMDLDYIVAIVDHFRMSRTRTLKALGVLQLDDLHATVGESPTLETASQVQMLRELLARAEEDDPNVAEPSNVVRPVHWGEDRPLPENFDAEGLAASEQPDSDDDAWD